MEVKTVPEVICGLQDLAEELAGAGPRLAALSLWLQDTEFLYGKTQFSECCSFFSLGQLFLCI